MGTHCKMQTQARPFCTAHHSPRNWGSWVKEPNSLLVNFICDGGYNMTVNSNSTTLWKKLPFILKLLCLYLQCSDSVLLSPWGRLQYSTHILLCFCFCTTFRRTVCINFASWSTESTPHVLNTSIFLRAQNTAENPWLPLLFINYEIILKTLISKVSG